MDWTDRAPKSILWSDFALLAILLYSLADSFSSLQCGESAFQVRKRVVTSWDPASHRPKERQGNLKPRHPCQQLAAPFVSDNPVLYSPEQTNLWQPGRS